MRTLHTWLRHVWKAKYESIYEQNVLTSKYFLNNIKELPNEKKKLLDIPKLYSIMQYYKII